MIRVDGNQIIALSKFTNYMKKVQIMGILNLTPDSFYDGDKRKLISNSNDLDKAFKKVLNADIIDVGGESSRPGSKEISYHEEIDRISVFNDFLKEHRNKVFSIDTYKPEVAQYALDNGYSMINDIYAGRYSNKMFELAASYKVPIVLMHMRGSPENMQKHTKYDSLLDNILNFFDERITEANHNGVLDENIILDPGVGFAKHRKDNYLIIKNIGRIKKMGYKVLIGLSRKSFLSSCKDSPEDRLLGTMIMNTIAFINGVDILRVHDVEDTIYGINVLHEYINS